jgi:MoaA/NifB/PqqE/SkfB family radical SAM enzyme
VSDEVLQKKLNVIYIEKVLIDAKNRGAERAVITGGGEPTLIPHHILRSYISLCKKYFDKIVMITNGYTYSGPKIDELMRKNLLLDLQLSGLNVLSVSRHGFDEDSNEKIMHLRTNVSLIGDTIKNNKVLFDKLRLRLVCVIQKNGVDSYETLETYIEWASSLGVNQICFKELYVSVTEESVYYDRKYNQFSRDNQIPLNMVVTYLESKKSKIVDKLPWGSPVYAHELNGKIMNIACYTEPSLFWERSNGICRSWNLMADGKIYASLEDLGSIIKL